MFSLLLVGVERRMRRLPELRALGAAAATGLLCLRVAL